MHCAEPSLDTVSRRTRSRWDAFYRKRYNEIRKKSDQENRRARAVTDCGQGRRLESSNASSLGKRASKNADCVTIDDSEDSSVADDSDDDENSTDDDLSGEDWNKDHKPSKKNKASADDSGKDYKMRFQNYVKEKGSRKVGRPSKKKKACANDSDKDGKMYSYNYVKQEQSRKVGRPSKKTKACAHDSGKDDRMYFHNYVKEKESYKVGRPSKKDKASADDLGKDYKMYFHNYVEEKRSRKFGRSSKNKARLIGESDLIKLMVDSLWKKKDSMGSTLKKEIDLLQAKPASLEENDPSQSMLPLKFRFEDHQSFFPEKMDLDEELDSLFDDMEIGLCKSESGCMNSSMTDDERTNATDIVESPAAPCLRGAHHTVLDEQIGIICTCCHSMLLEIKYVLPTLHVEPQESPGKKGMEDLDDFCLNQIDFQGNTCGKLESSLGSQGTVLDLIPDAEAKLYPHQLDGFKFLWRNIAGDIHINKLERLSPVEGSGCIISHAPGTGKTRLAILFLQTFLKMYPSCHPVIIAPCGMLLTWEQEFRKWKFDIKFHNLNESKLSQEESSFAASIVDQARVNKNNIDYVRFIKLCSWMKGGRILGVGYRLFEELASGHSRKRCGDKFKKMLLELPDILVMDEGHTPRNHKSLMWKALTKVTTRRRVMLSGTPFQNNFSELYNTLCLVNPRFSHQITRTDCNRKIVKRRGRKRKSNAARDEWAYLTRSITNDATSKDRLKKLQSMIEPFVHIHNGCILQKALPGLRDCLIMLKPTDLQSKLLQNVDRFGNFMEQAYISSLISVHPSLVSEKPEFSEHRRELKSLETSSYAGVKTRVLIKLIQQSVRLNEKVLVFSEFLDPLHHIHTLLKHHFSWNEGRELIYMNGVLSIKQRQHMINSFNDKKGDAKVLLASLKACSEGINLVGASRVVLLDVVWNPSVERQAICRAYRLGQEKVVHVYHLVTAMEVKKYAKQAEKERFNELIFCSGSCVDVGSKSRSKRTPSLGSETVVLFEDKVLEAMVGQQSIAAMVERIVHQPKESDLVNTFGFVDLK